MIPLLPSLSWKKKSKKIIVGLFFFYLLTRFFNLLSLPIFNDESIYLHWGNIMVNTPQTFLSLFDGKPPLILWLFGLTQKLPLDPLVSGRGVSIIFGGFTLWGILKVCQLLNFSQRGQIIAGLLYITNPLILFFDRLALLDGPISTIFIWIVFFSMRFHLLGGVLGGGTPQTLSEVTAPKGCNLSVKFRNVLLLGLIQGLGLWVKGTSQIFLFLPFTIPLISLMSHKDPKRLIKETVPFAASFLVAQVVFLPIRFQPLFSAYQKREGDFLNFSLAPLVPNLTLTVLIFLVFLTPFVIVFAALGFLSLYKKMRQVALFTSFFFLFPLVFEVLTARYFLSRYFIFTFLPVLILAAYGLEKYSIRVIFPALLVPLLTSALLVINPLITLKTISFTQDLSNDLSQYYTGWPSGYGVKETINWLKNESQKGPFIVITRADSGNPEDAIFVYLQNNKKIVLAQAGRKPTKEELEPFKQLPIYFVSRGTQLLNMEDQLIERKLFKKPIGDEFVGIYQIKQ